MPASREIVASILQGTQPVDLTAEALAKRVDLPLDWREQKALLGFDRRWSQFRKVSAEMGIRPTGRSAIVRPLRTRFLFKEDEPPVLRLRRHALCFALQLRGELTEILTRKQEAQETLVVLD